MTSPADPPLDITRLLQDWRNGDPGALDRLTPLVYDELHVIVLAPHVTRVARQHVSETALVSEAYLKLMGQRNVEWQNRAHFFAIAAQLMRRILVDNARRERRPKHGAGQRGIAMDDVAAAASVEEVDAVDALALDVALNKLATIDPDQARIVELRFFGGHDHRRNRRSDERFPCHYQARVGAREGVAVSRADRRQLPPLTGR